MATNDRPGATRPSGLGLRALKVSVILMGLLIVGGMIVIVVTLFNRASEWGERADAPAGPLQAALPLGAGDRIESAVLDGDRALIVVARAGGGQQVLVVDARTGALLLTLDAAADPAPDPAQ